MCSSDCFLAFLAVLFPPLPVWVKRGVCSADSLINITLWILGYIPGLLHAWYIIAKYPDEYPYGYEPLANEQGGGYVFYFPVRAPYTARPQGYSPIPSPSYATFPGHAAQVYPQSNPQPNPHPSPSPRPQHNPQSPPPPPQNLHPQFHPANDPVNTPERYTNYPQQTPVAGPSVPVPEVGLPSYADAVKGDYKVQTQD